jgi:hypothetical protein
LVLELVLNFKEAEVKGGRQTKHGGEAQETALSKKTKKSTRQEEGCPSNAVST